ncbi:MAG: prolyl oligopeptidase family serine peptidase [Planctomycetia bacterium]|nr:prolyl oligopeptidase family serine peptidase [Planctomycetia bacterium]
MKKMLFVLTLLIPSLLVAAEFPGTKSSWNGFDMYRFSLDGRPVQVVLPKEPAAGNPWVWRAVFFGHEPQTEIAMLNRGWYVAWIGTSDLLGSPQCTAERTSLYNLLVNDYKFHPKPVMLGMSRGGICSLMWAIANPDKVAGLYIDAPVCDLKSWPGGKGKGCGSKGDWAQALKVFNMNEEELMNFKGNPIHACTVLAEHKVPILIVAGDSDRTVPWEENGLILSETYKKAGGNVEIILKPGCDHHPHSLKDPTPIVDFMLKCAK